MVAPEQTRVTGRRLIAHLADGVALMVILLVVGVPAAIVSDALLAVVLAAWLIFGHLIYVIALVGMLSSRYRQRFGDRWAKTFVIDA